MMCPRKKGGKQAYIYWTLALYQALFFLYFLDFILLLFKKELLPIIYTWRISTQSVNGSEAITTRKSPWRAGKLLITLVDCKTHDLYEAEFGEIYQNNTFLVLLSIVISKVAMISFSLKRVHLHFGPATPFL